jgi:hypothetical protein
VFGWSKIPRKLRSDGNPLASLTVDVDVLRAPTNRDWPPEHVPLFPWGRDAQAVVGSEIEHVGAMRPLKESLDTVHQTPAPQLMGWID